MNKKEISEIKKVFAPKNCRVDLMKAVYVNSEKDKIFSMNKQFLNIGEEELHKYCDIFKKGLSGRVGKNLYNLSYKAEDEAEGSTYDLLNKLYKTDLSDNTVVDAFFNKVIEHYVPTGSKYVAMLIHGVYDVPTKAKDKSTLEDSETVYRFIQFIICPVELMKEGLCADPLNSSFVSRADDWSIKAPTLSFLYPAFNDRSADIHSVLYYTKNAEERNENFVANILGLPLGTSEKEEKTAFIELIESTLGRQCTVEKVKDISDSVNDFLREQSDTDEDAVRLSKRDLRNILEQNNVDAESLKRYDSSYDELLGKNALNVHNITDPAKLTVEADNVKLSLKSEIEDILETKVVDGIEYLMIPVSNNMTVNGISVKLSQQPEA